jgi:hypothetical protein
MRLLLAALLVATAAGGSAIATQSFQSTTFIEPDKAFLLGGGQPGAFTVTGRNAGPAAVTVFVERNGQRDSVTTIAPGAKVDAEFPKGAMAIFRNQSSRESAVLKVTLRGQTSGLGMRYEAARR